MALSAMDDDGNPVDWWFMYKVAGESTTSTGARGPVLDGKKLTGTEYIYFDANTPSTGKLVLSPNTVQGGALSKTLNQIYGAPKKSPSLGWLFYNDENPINGVVNSTRGLAKGVLAFDLSSNTAFWLVQSIPRFAPKGKYAFPKSGMANAQTLLCVTLHGADVARSIAKQMYVAQQPNVYLASEIPAALVGQPNDPRVKLMRDQVAAGDTPVHVVIPFQSKGGVKFLSIAKNKSWDLDFYNDLVGPMLKDNLDVETWEHDPVPPSQDSDKHHTLVAMKEVNLQALGIDLAWSEKHDHAKLTISSDTEPVHYVCVGDINYTSAQCKRGGGTVAFQCEALWNSLSSILERATLPNTRAATKSAPAARSTTVSAPPPTRSIAKQAVGHAKRPAAKEKRTNDSTSQLNGKRASARHPSPIFMKEHP